LRCQSAAVDVTLHAPGLHNLRNALAAAACALAAGVPLATVAQGLSAFSPVSGRMQPHVLENGFQLIDDTYNANPDSVRAAIDVLASLKGPTVLVLGAMAEVGDNGPAMHAEVGAYASTQHVDHLLSLGTNAAECSRAFGDGARHFENIDDLVEHLAGLMPAHVLVKGSRSSRMERVVKAFQQLQSQAGGEHHAA
jgi:murE/murF fusion protein